MYITVEEIKTFEDLKNVYLESLKNRRESLKKR